MKKGYEMVYIYVVAAILFVVDAIMAFQGGKSSNGIVWLCLCAAMIGLSAYTVKRAKSGANGNTQDLGNDISTSSTVSSSVEMKFDDSDEDIFADMREENK